MKNILLYICFLWIMSPTIIGQTVCDQFLVAAKTTNQDTFKKRSFRMFFGTKEDKNMNITEADTLGRIHFWGSVGSLRIESFYADGKKYAKIQSDFIQDDEWTWQEANVQQTNAHKWFKLFKNETQYIDCQLVGEENLQSQKCTILSYSLQKQMPKRSGVDSFLMTAHVKTWFCVDNNLVYKHAYEMTTELVSQTVHVTIEYDVPVKMDIPQKAKYEAPTQIKRPPSVTITQNNRYEEKTVPLADSNKLVAQKQIVPSDTTQIRDTTTIFAAVDQAPEYKAGLSALYKFISDNMHFPEEARKEGLSGTVQVSFVVEIDGTLSNIHIKKSIHENVDTEAIRVVQSMSGAWKAAQINGKEVRSTFTLPLRFELRE